jgi:hypothetical protein
MAEEKWATGAVRMAILLGMVGIGLVSAFFVANVMVDIAIPIVGRKYLP